MVITIRSNVDAGKTRTILHVRTGYYELKAINDEIIRIRGNSDITILPNVNTLQCILTVVGAKCKVSFDVLNSLADVIGFKRSIYGVGCHASENLVKIMSETPFWYIATVAYNFFPNATSGQKMLDAPHNLIYLPVTVDVISTLTE